MDRYGYPDSSTARKKTLYPDRKQNREAATTMPDDYLITINLSASKPIYRQIVEAVIVHVATGKLLPGDKLPSSRRLSSLLGINYHTVNKAYDLLSREGFVHLDRRKKVVINELNKSEVADMDATWMEKARALVSEAVSRGFSDVLIMQKIQSIIEEIADKRAES